MAYILSMIVGQIDQNTDAVEYVESRYSPFCQQGIQSRNKPTSFIS